MSATVLWRQATHLRCQRGEVFTQVGVEREILRIDVVVDTAGRNVGLDAALVVRSLHPAARSSSVAAPTRTAASIASP